MNNEGKFRFATFIILIIFTVCLLSCSAFSYSRITKNGKYTSAVLNITERNTVIIDAGHGGEDPGTISQNGTYEKDLNLAIAKILGEELTKKGFAVIYTRTDDRMLYEESENIKGIKKISDLKNRCKIAAEYPEAIFISIHMNSYSQSKYKGFQAYYSKENSLSYLLANEIQSAVIDSIQPENKRTVKSGEDLYLLKNISNPTVLLECGFLSNEEECKKLLEKEYQKQLSLAIVYGIINYTGKLNDT